MLEGLNIRKVLEESNLPIEIASAIADRCERVPEGRQTDPDASDPQTKGSWEERCAALYQVIGALSSYAGIFSVSDDVAAALDVAAGDGDVEKLLPWPKDMKLFTALEEHCKGRFDMNDGEGKK